MSRATRPEAPLAYARRVHQCACPAPYHEARPKVEFMQSWWRIDLTDCANALARVSIIIVGGPVVAIAGVIFNLF